MEQNKDQGGAAVRGEAVAVNERPKALEEFYQASVQWEGVCGHPEATLDDERRAEERFIAAGKAMRELPVSARAADAPSEPSELCGIPTLRDLAELFHASAMSNTAVLIHPESARSLFDAMTTLPKDESAPLSYVCRVELHQDRIILDDKYESIDTVRTALAKSRAADALDSQPTAPNNYHDAYRGARDDLADWKRRALSAEESCRKMAAAINAENGPTFMGEPASSQPTESPDAEYILDGYYRKNGKHFDKLRGHPNSCTLDSGWVAHYMRVEVSSQPTDGGVRNG